MLFWESIGHGLPPKRYNFSHTLLLGGRRHLQMWLCSQGMGVCHTLWPYYHQGMLIMSGYIPAFSYLVSPQGSAGEKSCKESQLWWRWANVGPYLCAPVIHVVKISAVISGSDSQVLAQKPMAIAERIGNERIMVGQCSACPRIFPLTNYYRMNDLVVLVVFALKVDSAGFSFNNWYHTRR